MSDQVKTVSDQNKELKKELWERGYYVVEVGQLQAGEVDYLVFSCSALNDSQPIDHIAN